MKIKLTDGEIELVKPKAGVRNRAILASETSDGVLSSKYMMELLPGCIRSHPWGTTPIKQALDSLEIEDYDELIEGLKKLLTPKEGNPSPKSEEPSKAE